MLHSRGGDPMRRSPCGASSYPRALSMQSGRWEGKTCYDYQSRSAQETEARAPRESQVSGHRQHRLVTRRCGADHHAEAPKPDTEWRYLKDKPR